MKRTYVRINLRMDSDWRVGAWDSDSADTLPVLTDADDRPVAPGSGIAGSLRHAVNDQRRQELFGPDPGAEELSASPWWVLGTVVEGSRITARQRNRIDRARGSASERGLYRVKEVGPKAGETATVRVYLRRQHDSRDPDSEILAPLIEVLKAWEPRIGGGASTGLGRATITNVTHQTIDLDDIVQLKNVVCGDGQDPVARVDALLAGGTTPTFLAGKESHDTSWLKAKLKVDFLALPDNMADRIHGSSWKGLLRSRVEFIGRSLGYKVCGAKNENSDETGWTGCGECAVCRAFGSSQRPGLWAFDDSPFGGMGTSASRDRIAIDRFTGGVRDGALWEQLYRQDVDLDLVVRRNPMVHGISLGPEDSWVKKAIIHALRDLNDGLIGIGPESAAGFGLAKVENLTVDGSSIDLGAVDTIPYPDAQEVAS